MNLNVFQGKAARAAVVEHTLNTHTGKELITYWISFWRPMLPELNTHRMLSKSASSSRAIPLAKRLQEVRDDPKGPIHWGLNQSGMQAFQEVNEDVKDLAKKRWRAAASSAAYHAELMGELNIHKQVANRMLEPYLNVDVVISGTEWENFFLLRDHGDAQPEIRDLAQVMKVARDASSPRHAVVRSLKDPRDWHLPFVTLEERKNHFVRDLLAMSSARCARTSYNNHLKLNPTLEEDDGLYRRLVETEPRHASPLEHQAVVTKEDLPCANYRGGWIQHRHVLEYAGSIQNLRDSLTDKE